MGGAGPLVRWLLVALIAAAAAIAPPAAAQLPGLLSPADPPATPAEDATGGLRAEREAAEAAAAEALREREVSVAFAEAARGSIAAAETELATARSRAEGFTAADVAALPVAELRDRLTATEAEAATTRSRAVSVKAEADRLERRLEALPAETQDAREAVDAARVLLEAATEGAEAELREAQLQAAEARLAQLTAHATSLPLRERLERLNLDLLNERAARQGRELELLHARDTELRRQEAEEQARLARKAAAEASGLPPEARRLAQRLLELAARQEEIQKQAAGLAGRADDARRDAELYRTQLDSARERVAFGMTEAVGVQFQARRRELRDVADPAGLRKRIAMLRERQAAYATTLLDLADDERTFQNLLDAARETLAGEADPAAAERAAVLSSLAQTVEESLAAASATARRAQADVTELLTAEEARRDALTAYADFLNERLLWTPDLGRLGPADLPRAAGAAREWWSRLDAAAAADKAAEAAFPRLWWRRSCSCWACCCWGRMLGCAARSPNSASRSAPSPATASATPCGPSPPPCWSRCPSRSCCWRWGGRWPRRRAWWASSAPAWSAPPSCSPRCCWCGRSRAKDGLAEVHFLWPADGCRALRSAILKLGLLLAAFRFCSNFLAPGSAAGVATSFAAGTNLSAAAEDAVDLRLIGRLFLIVTLVGVSVFMARIFRRNGASGPRCGRSRRRHSPAFTGSGTRCWSAPRWRWRRSPGWATSTRRWSWRAGCCGPCGCSPPP